MFGLEFEETTAEIFDQFGLKDHHTVPLNTAGLLFSCTFMREKTNFLSNDVHFHTVFYRKTKEVSEHLPYHFFNPEMCNSDFSH